MYHIIHNNCYLYYCVLSIIDDSHSSASQSEASCPNNKVCPTGFKQVRFLKTNCEDFLAMGLKYQHLSPPSPEVDYVPIRVEIRDEWSRFPLKVLILLKHFKLRRSMYVSRDNLSDSLLLRMHRKRMLVCNPLHPIYHMHRPQSYGVNF